METFVLQHNIWGELILVTFDGDRIVGLSAPVTADEARWGLLNGYETDPDDLEQFVELGWIEQYHLADA